MSQYNYEVLMKEFCQYKGYSKNKSNSFMKKEIVEADLFHLDAFGIRHLIIEDIKANTYTSIKSYTSLLRQFCEWAAKEKKIEVKNYFDDEILQVKPLTYYGLTKNPLPVIDDQKLEEIISRLTINREYYELLLRLSYEGITLDELVELKKQDVDAENGYIKAINGRMNMSLPLREAVTAYESFCMYEAEDGRQFEVQDLFHESFIRDYARNDVMEDRTQKELKTYYSKRTYRLYELISGHVGITIDRKDIYYNGFISFVERKCGGDKEMTMSLFLSNKNIKEKVDLLIEYAKEFRMEVSRGNVRARYVPYVMQRYMF